MVVKSVVVQQAPNSKSRERSDWAMSGSSVRIGRLLEMDWGFERSDQTTWGVESESS